MFCTKDRESIFQQTRIRISHAKTYELQIDSEVQNMEFDMLSWYGAEWSWENW